MGKQPSTLGIKLYSVIPLLKSKFIPKVVESNALSKPVTSNLTPSTRESKVVNSDRVIAPGMFRIHPSKTSRVDNVVPNKTVKASVRIKPITVSQPHVITKKDVNSDLDGLSSTGVNNTAQTRRPQPRSNIKNDRVPSTSKSSCIKNKEVENDNSEVVCAMCKQCLITANHDVCVLNYVNNMNSYGDKHSANASKITNQKKHKPKVKKPKKVVSKERLATPKLSKPRIYLSSKGDNACTSNPKELISKRFPNSTFSLAGTSNLFMVHQLWLLKEYDRKFEATHKFCMEVFGTVRFGNDHITAILGYGDL
ncbi:hypothetical protein Tco_1507157 [Tanacetum coccineum]